MDIFKYIYCKRNEHWVHIDACHKKTCGISERWCKKKRYKVTKGTKWISPDDPDYIKETA